jgi:hypothetical protein
MGTSALGPGCAKTGGGDRHHSARKFSSGGNVPPSMTYSVPFMAAARGDAGKEGYQIGHLAGFRRPPERNPAKRIHDDLLAASHGDFNVKAASTPRS